MAKKSALLVIPAERIEKAILALRGQKVMLDRDLAELYGVKAIALRQQVKRNRQRFPEDFMFQLTPDEADTLVSQNVIPSLGRLGGSLPYPGRRGHALQPKIATKKGTISLWLSFIPTKRLTK